MAGTATQLVVNCIDASVPPPGGHCFDAYIGKPFTFWVLALDSNGVVIDYSGTVAFSTSDSTASLPGQFTFTATDKGAAKFTAVFHSVTSKHIPSFELITANDGNLSASTNFSVFPAPFTATPLLGIAGLTFIAVSIVLIVGRKRFRPGID